MTVLNRNSPLYRDLLWVSCQNELGQVLCNICRLPVRAGDAWHESHTGAPKALGGITVGIAHDKCNLDHGRAVTRAVAKAKRQRRKHLGITTKGQGKRPLPCGRKSKLSKTISNGVVARQSQHEKHRATMAKRSFTEGQT